MYFFFKAMELLFDHRLEHKTKYAESSALIEINESLNTVKNVAAFLGYVAAVDGKLEEKERELIRNLCRDLLEKNLTASYLENHDGWRESIEKAIESATLRGELLEIARSHSDFRFAFLVYAWQVAARDGKVDRQEIQTITRIGLEMQAELQEIERSSLPYYRPPSTEQDRISAQDLLGLTEHYDLADITRHFLERFDTLRNSNLDDGERTAKIADLVIARQVLVALEENIDYGLDGEMNRIAPLETLKSSNCFVCGRSHPVANRDEWTHCRCTSCRALLYFDQIAAESLR